MTRQPPASLTSTTSRRTVLLPRSMLASRGGVTAAGRGTRRWYLLLESPDVVDDLPAVLLGQVLPRRHGAAAVGDLPEQLAVSLALDLGRGPVGRLGRRQRRRGHAVALARGAVARDAVGLDELLRVPD